MQTDNEIDEILVKGEMNREQFERFINAMMLTESDEETVPNDDTDDDRVNVIHF